MQDTLQNLKNLRVKIDKLKVNSQKNMAVIEDMMQKSHDLPQDTHDFVNSLPNSVIDRIHQELDEEFEMSLASINPKPIKTRMKRPIRGVRI